MRASLCCPATLCSTEDNSTATGRASSKAESCALKGIRPTAASTMEIARTRRFHLVLRLSIQAQRERRTNPPVGVDGGFPGGRGGTRTHDLTDVNRALLPAELRAQVNAL